MHDWKEQRAETFDTFKQAGRGVKLPKEAVVVYLFLPDENDANYAPVEKALQARGFKTKRDGEVLEARFGPIKIDAESVWFWEHAATEIALPFDFEPDGWELDE